MSSLYTNLKDKGIFVDKLKEFIYLDLKDKFNNINIDYEDLLLEDAIVEINSKLNERFIFLIDEWDVVLREEEYNTKLCDDYIMFLRSLFKSSDVSACIDLVYMTGILPIRRYRAQSTLNMFTEYNMIRSR